jgi:hypothetical protein
MNSHIGENKPRPCYCIEYDVPRFVDRCSKALRLLFCGTIELKILEHEMRIMLKDWHYKLILTDEEYAKQQV